MNLTPTNVVVLGAGIILIYCAIYNLKVKDVIVAALHGKSTRPPKPKTTPNAPGGGGGRSIGFTTNPVIVSV